MDGYKIHPVTRPNLAVSEENKRRVTIWHLHPFKLTRKLRFEKRKKKTHDTPLETLDCWKNKQHKKNI